MTGFEPGKYKRVLIVSANPLFGVGLSRLFARRMDQQAEKVRLVNNMEETFSVLREWKPDLVIVDYDDQTINRAEFLNRFVVDDQPMQVMLVSLQKSGAVVVYDRKTLSPSEAEEWLNIIDDKENTNMEEKHQKLIPPRRSNMRHFVIIAVLVVLSTFLVNLLLNSINILPVQASLQAIEIDRLFGLHFWIISFLFSLIVIFMIYSLIAFRSKPGDESEGVHIRGINNLELFWTIIPLITVIVISYIGAQSLAETRREDPQAMRVKVTAGQWFWRYEYPEYGITSSSLNLPVNQQVVLEMTSVDVIHSFWVPEFRVKQDILPGENLVKELRFTPTVVGNYTVRCAELCGGSHAYMNSPVVVMTEEIFSDWVQEELGAVSDDPVARGEALARVSGCIGCHTLDGSTSVGPTWLDMYGSERELTDGSTVEIDEEYLINAIINPNEEIPVGYPPNVMPQTYVDTLSDQEIQDLVAFMKSLSQ